ncbi:MAG: hypothetical protein Q4C96_10790 [Planctomycetia bacterium]|nr:hypothetical protein [Planctomycetia bacterium]
MNTTHEKFTLRKQNYWKNELTGIFFLLFLMCFSAPVWGDKYWSQGSGYWDESGNWSSAGSTDAIYIGDGSDSTANTTVTVRDATATPNGNLTLSESENLYIGFDSSLISGRRSGIGNLVVEGSLTTEASIYLGQQNFYTYWSQNRSETPLKNVTTSTSAGAGNLTVGTGLTIEGSLYMARDGSSSLTVSSGDVLIGSGDSSTIQIGGQLYGASSSVHPGFTAVKTVVDGEGNSTQVVDPITVDFSGTENVTINVKGFYIAAYPGTYKSLGNKHPSGTGYNGRYEYTADVDFGTNTTITASEMVVASSYGVNLAGTDPTTVDFGTGTTTLNINDFYIGYWKAENAVYTGGGGDIALMKTCRCCTIRCR